MAGLWPCLAYIAVHLMCTERSEPADVIIGHVEAQHPGVLLLCSGFLRSDTFTSISGAEVDRWKATGVACTVPSLSATSSISSALPDSPPRTAPPSSADLFEVVKCSGRIEL